MSATSDPSQLVQFNTTQPEVIFLVIDIYLLLDEKNIFKSLSQLFILVAIKKLLYIPKKNLVLKI